MNVTLDFDLGLNNKKSDNEKENLQNNFINERSFGDLTISDIGDKNSIPNSQRTHENDDNHNNNHIINKFENRASLGSVKLEDFNQMFLSKKNKIKLTKEDLNNIPLPLFSCIYCSNESISFKHFLNEILIKKYVLLTSIYDIKQLDKILSHKFLVDKFDENDKLEDIIIKNTEYLKKYYNYNDSKLLMSELYDDKIKFKIHDKNIQQIIYILNKLKSKKLKKNLNKINSLNKKYYHYYSFNSNLNNNTSINNINHSIDVAGELNLNNNKKIVPFNINQTSSNLSVSNFNSVSLINYFDNNIPKEKENRFKLDDIIEQIEKNSAVEDGFGFDLNRKIKKEDIEWEKDFYNIWSPIIEIISLQYNPATNNNNNLNKTFTNKKTKDNNEIIIKKVISKPSRENEKVNNNKYSKKKSKNISPNNIKFLKKHTITQIIAHSNSKNKKRNIFINLNDTPKLQNYTQSKIKMNSFYKKVKSDKNLQNIITKSLNKKKKCNLNPISLFNSQKNILKLKYHQIMKSQKPLNISLVNKTNIIKKAKSKINIGKSLNNNNKNEQKEKTNRSKNNKNNFFSQNSSTSNNKKKKKTEPKNASLKKINGIKNYIRLQNKITRNHTFQNLENIKEKSIIINIKNYGDGSYDSPTRISQNNKNQKIESKAMGINNNKINKKNISNNKKIKDKKNNIINGNNLNKNKSINAKKNITKENNNYKKNIYDVKILIKKNIEIKTKNYDYKKKKIK